MPTITGTSGDDTLNGTSSTSNIFEGLAGNDSLTGTSGAANMSDYIGSPTGIVADLTKGTVQDGYGSVDHLANIEQIQGSTFNDVITGDAQANILIGGGGSDSLSGGDGADRLEDTGNGFTTLNGGSGDDWMVAGVGNDALTGGTGADTFHSSAGAGTDVVTDFSYAQGDRVMLDHGTTFTVAQSGADVVVDMGNGDQLVVQNTTLASLPSDWIFS
jgi:serralysin